MMLKMIMKDEYLQRQVMRKRERKGIPEFSHKK